MTGIAAVLVLFSDPRVFLRVLVPIPGIPEAIGAVIVAGFALACFGLRGRDSIRGRWALLLAGFATVSLVRFLVAGYDWLTVVQWVPAYVGAIGAAAVGLNGRFVRSLFVAFAAAMTLHAVSIHLAPEFILQGLDVHTAYGVSSGADRATGLTYAPGFLALLSSMGVAAGIVMSSSERSWVWLLLLASSLVCGLATLNRSFLGGATIAAAAGLALCLLIGARRTGAVIASGILLGALLVGVKATDYGWRMSERLERPVLRDDVETRTTGAAGVIPALLAAVRNPLWGSVDFNPQEGRVMVYDGERFVMVHNGFAWTLATRGIVVGLVFYYWSALAIARLWRATAAVDREERMYVAALLGMYVAGHAVSLVEAFHETFVMLLPIAIGASVGHARTRRRGTAPTVFNREGDVHRGVSHGLREAAGQTEQAPVLGRAE